MWLFRESGRLFWAILIVLVSGFGITSCQRGIHELSVETLGQLVEVEGSLEKIWEEGKGLEILLQGDDRLFRDGGGYPKYFHRAKLVLTELNPGDRVVLTVPQRELDELPQKKRWRWAEFVGLRSSKEVWLTPEEHVRWDRENRQAGVWLLCFICACGLLWTIALLFPSLEEPIANGVKWLFTLFMSAKGWVGAAFLLLLVIPASKNCWIEWHLRDAPMVSGTVVKRELVKRYWVIPFHIIQIKPDGSNARIFADARQETPDKLEFRWDGEAEWIYLREESGNPWGNLALMAGLGIAALGIALMMSWAMRQEEFWS